VAKYFIHNNEQELTRGHELLNNVPDDWTIVEYQNPGDQADISDAALAIESETGLGISGHPSIVVQLNLFDRLYKEDGTKNTDIKSLQWRCIHVQLTWSWEDIQNEMDAYVSLNEEAQVALLAESP
jgi:hypothetical protein